MYNKLNRWDFSLMLQSCPSEFTGSQTESHQRSHIPRDRKISLDTSTGNPT